MNLAICEIELELSICEVTFNLANFEKIRQPRKFRKKYRQPRKIAIVRTPCPCMVPSLLGWYEQWRINPYPRVVDKSVDKIKIILNILNDIFDYAYFFIKRILFLHLFFKAYFFTHHII